MRLFNFMAKHTQNQPADLELKRRSAAAAKLRELCKIKPTDFDESIIVTEMGRPRVNKDIVLN
jgi:hypothetical protein